jgi:hypothetical protein
MIETLEDISAHAVRRFQCAFYCFAVVHALQLFAIDAPYRKKIQKKTVCDR